MTHPATLLKNSWRAYAHNFRALLVLTLPIAALSAIAIIMARLMPTDPNFELDGAPWVRAAIIVGVFVAVAIFIVVARVFSTAVIVSSYRSLGDQKPNLKESIKVGWRTFWPVLWVAILRGLVVLGGLILLVVPGIIWALRYSLAVQVAAIEGKTGLSALHRSKDLTRGKLLETFINFGVIGAIFGYGTWLVIVVTWVVFMGLAAMISLVISTNLFNTSVVLIFSAAEAVIVWFAVPLSPLAVTSVYKDFSDK